MLVLQVMRLIRVTLEYGIWAKEHLYDLIKIFFSRTEQLLKQEVYLSKSNKEYHSPVYSKLKSCKQECASILLQIIVMVDDEWFYFRCKNPDSKISDKLEKLKYYSDDGNKKNKKSSELNDLIDSEKGFSLFLLTKHFYMNFSFIMFNYLLYSVEEDKAN